MLERKPIFIPVLSNEESYEMVGSVWMSNNLNFEEHIVLIPRYKAILDFNIRSVFDPGSI